MTATPPTRPMSDARRPLTHLGTDVRIVGRCADGRAVVAFLDRHGAPLGRYAAPWAHELRGVGWHISEIKRAIAAAPVLSGAPDCAVVISAAPARPPAPRLHAHFTVPEGDR